MTAMKMTQNRLLILRLLDEDIDTSMPPHSVGSLHYKLENVVEYKYKGYPELTSVPDKSSINRTCVDLLKAGLIVVSRVKRDDWTDQLPYWEKEYQLASSVERNYLISECNHLHSKVKTAKHGVNFFGAVMNQGLSVEEVNILAQRVRAMLQRTHPDKVDGYEEQFKLMNKANRMLKSGIPLPDDRYGATTIEAHKTVPVIESFL